jgi:Putative Ig domain
LLRLKQTPVRRRVGFAAAAVLAGGLVGTALLAPGTAFAGPMQLSTTTTITGTTQAFSGGTTTLDAAVTVATPSGSPQAPAGSVTVSDGSGHCTFSLTVGTGGSLTSYGNCALLGLTPGNYKLTATYTPSSMQFTSSTSKSVWVTVSNPNVAPKFTADSPSLNTRVGSHYSYTFAASGTPAPTFSLVDAPSWLSINSATGVVSGTVPRSAQWGFSYSVAASNSVGTVPAGPFAVNVGSRNFHHSHLTTQLYCPASVTNGRSGTCTLTVGDNGWGSGRTSAVTASIYLPSELHARSCSANVNGQGQGQPWPGNQRNCWTGKNSVMANLGSLRPGQTKTLAVSFSAHLNSWGWQQSHAARVSVVGTAQNNSGVSSSKAYVTIFPRFVW